MGELEKDKSLERLVTEPVVCRSASENPTLVYLASLSVRGRKAMRDRLNIVAERILGVVAEEGSGVESWQLVPWERIRYQHVAAIRTKLQEMGLAPATVNLTLYAFRGVARAAFNLKQISADDYQRIRSVSPIKAERLLRGRALAPGEIAGLMDACMANGRPAGARDAAMIALMYATGIRRAEVPTLNLDDYNPETGELRVRGKGDKERMLYVNNGAADALDDWLEIRGREPGPLFLPVDKGSNIKSERLSDHAVYEMLKRRGEQAGVKEFSPHDLRRTFVSDLLDAGADITTVQHLAGHATIQTTAKYDRRGEEAKKKAVGLLHVPYRKRSKKGES
jgi:site-specific recombinase XerD